MSTELEKRTETAMQSPLDFNTFMGMKGVSGYEVSDLPMPYLRLTQKMTEDKSLSDGTQARDGQLVHSAKKVAYDSLKIIVLFVKKGIVMKENFDGMKEPIEEHRVLAVSSDDLDSPFVIFLTKANIGAWKKCFSEMVANKLPAVYANYVTVSSEDITYVKVNKTSKIFKFKLEQAVDPEVLKKVEPMADRFGKSDEILEQPEETKPMEKEDEINIDDIPF